MKLTKKLISIVLTSVFLLSFVSIPASAEVDDVTKTINMDYYARRTAENLYICENYDTIGDGGILIKDGHGDSLFLKFAFDGTVGYLKSAELDTLTMSKNTGNVDVYINKYSTADAPVHENPGT